MEEEKRKKRPGKSSDKIKDTEIIEEFRKIAFSEDEKTSDRLRALGLLSEHLEKQKKNDEVMRKLETILKKIKSGF